MSKKDKRIKSFQDLGKAMGYKPPADSGTSKTPKANPGREGGNNDPGAQAKKTINFLEKDVDYVSIAEKRMKALMTPNSKNPFGNLTTSKIRNILSLVNDIYSQVINWKEEELPQEITDRIRYIKVRLAYEAGRENQQTDRDKDKKIKEFIDKTGLIEAVDYIASSREKFIRYAKYLEALVAYHRYYGGKDN
ncbi:MAG: type III-A CRISPR-associated protein Csm2 [Syntrophomonadaceae bacterium]|nr:type III-A CRISPR-associated protein Csm2 [Syntrophomonadaceae bacterium]